MNDTASLLNASGLGSISATGLVLGLVFSGIGLAYIRYGRKQDRFSMFLAGLGLSIYPWFVSKPLPLTLIGLVLCGIPFVV